MGSEVALFALPLVAIFALHAGPFQVGLLYAAGVLPFVLIGLPAGVWVDRWGQRRPVLLIADVGRLIAVLSIPAAALYGHLSLAQLYVVAIASGMLTVFFDVAYQSYLSTLVDRDQLVDGNAKLQLTEAVALAGGPPLGGGLVGVVGAPFAMAADALSYACSVGSLLLLRRREPKPARAEIPRPMTTDIAAGLRYVLRHPLLRPIALCTATWNFFGHLYLPLLVLFCIRELGMSAATTGLVLGIGALGAPVGALLAPRITRKIGIGPTIVVSSTVGATALLVALAPRAHAVPFVIVGYFASNLGVVYDITQVSLRQAITEPSFQGRMNATMRFFVWGTIPVGSAVGGVIGSVMGLRAAMIIGVSGTTLAIIPVLFSRVRSLRTLDQFEGTM